MSASTDRKPERQQHRNWMRRYWKAIASVNEITGIYSRENLNRMHHGKAPRRLALIRHKKTGETIEFHAPVELHHVFGIHPTVSPDDQTIVEVYPWQHAAMDEDRKFNWEFVQWVGFQ